MDLPGRGLNCLVVRETQPIRCYLSNIVNLVSGYMTLMHAANSIRHRADNSVSARRRWRRSFPPLAALLLAGLGATPALADLKLCNTTASRVGVAIGYKDAEGWATEGWWNIASHTCETLLKGVLIGRFYYIHAVDYDRGGEWAGTLYMCTDDKSFTIRDTKDCVKRGYKKHRFLRGRYRRGARLDRPPHRSRGRSEVAMRRNRRVKIVATLGPASNNEETMRRLFEAGADVFRINMSHATHDGLRDIHAIVRKLEAEFSRPIGILVDLQGPKLRIGKFESGAIRLTEGDVLSFVRRESVGGLGPRAPAASRDLPGGASRAIRCCSTTASSSLRVVEASDVRIDAEVHDQRRARQPQGHQPARHRAALRAR